MEASDRNAVSNLDWKIIAARYLQEFQKLG